MICDPEPKINNQNQKAIEFALLNQNFQILDKEMRAYNEGILKINSINFLAFNAKYNLLALCVGTHILFLNINMSEEKVKDMNNPLKFLHLKVKKENPIGILFGFEDEIISVFYTKDIYFYPMNLILNNKNENNLDTNIDLDLNLNFKEIKTWSLEDKIKHYEFSKPNSDNLIVVTTEGNIWYANSSLEFEEIKNDKCMFATSSFNDSNQIHYLSSDLVMRTYDIKDSKIVGEDKIIQYKEYKVILFEEIQSNVFAFLMIDSKEKPTDKKVKIIFYDKNTGRLKECYHFFSNNINISEAKSKFYVISNKVLLANSLSNEILLIDYENEMQKEVIQTSNKEPIKGLLISNFYKFQNDYFPQLISFNSDFSLELYWHKDIKKTENILIYNALSNLKEYYNKRKVEEKKPEGAQLNALKNKNENKFKNESTESLKLPNKPIDDLKLKIDSNQFHVQNEEEKEMIDEKILERNPVLDSIKQFTDKFNTIITSILTNNQTIEIPQIQFEINNIQLQSMEMQKQIEEYKENQKKYENEITILKEMDRDPNIIFSKKYNLINSYYEKFIYKYQLFKGILECENNIFPDENQNKLTENKSLNFLGDKSSLKKISEEITKRITNIKEKSSNSGHTKISFKLRPLKTMEELRKEEEEKKYKENLIKMKDILKSSLGNSCIIRNGNSQLSQNKNMLKSKNFLKIDEKTKEKEFKNISSNNSNCFQSQGQNVIQKNKGENPKIDKINSKKLDNDKMLGGPTSIIKNEIQDSTQSKYFKDNNSKDSKTMGKFSFKSVNVNQYQNVPTQNKLVEMNLSHVSKSNLDYSSENITSKDAKKEKIGTKLTFKPNNKNK